MTGFQGRSRSLGRVRLVGSTGDRRDNDHGYPNLHPHDRFHGFNPSYLFVSALEFNTAFKLSRAGVQVYNLVKAICHRQPDTDVVVANFASGWQNGGAYKHRRSSR